MKKIKRWWNWKKKSNLIDHFIYIKKNIYIYIDQIWKRTQLKVYLEILKGQAHNLMFSIQREKKKKGF